MDAQNIANQPRLLMLSHCVPHPMGNADRARAWQFLKTVSRTHAVDLVCAYDAPVDLRHWRLLHSTASRVTIQPPSLFSSMTRIDVTSGFLPGFQAEQLPDFVHSERYDATLITHPALLDAIEKATVRVRICDLPGIVSRRKSTRGGNPKAFARIHHQLDRYCDLVTLSQHEDAFAWSALRCRTAVVSDAIDLTHYSDVSATDQLSAESFPPRIVVQRINQSGFIGGMLDRFSREVWPKLKRALPHAQLVNVHAGQMPGLFDGATLVVTPGDDQSDSQRPILHALAAGRVVVAPGSVTDRMGARHGEHLFAARSSREWVDCCIESLRSADLRLKLSRAGRRFVEQRYAMDNQAHELARTILPAAPSYPFVSPLAQAA